MCHAHNQSNTSAILAARRAGNVHRITEEVKRIFAQGNARVRLIVKSRSTSSLPIEELESLANRNGSTLDVIESDTLNVSPISKHDDMRGSGAQGVHTAWKNGKHSSEDSAFDAEYVNDAYPLPKTT